MSTQETPPGSSAELVRAALAEGDRRRRIQAASRGLWRVAPILMVAGVLAAAASRWMGISRVLPIAVLSGGAILVLARLVVTRRAHTISDPVAARLDEAANLGGELRSASWFAFREGRDPWADAHLGRAARRLEGADWIALFPTASARRAQAVTGLLALGVVALMILPAPPNQDRAAADATARVLGEQVTGSEEHLSPELQEQLEALLAQAEHGSAPPAGARATASQLRALIAQFTALRDAGRLKDLARAMAPAPGGGSEEAAKALKAMADRARNASRIPGIAPEARDALEQVAEITDSARAADPRPGETGAPASSARSPKSDGAPGTKEGEVDEASIQSVSEAEPGGGGGVIMMGSEDEAAGRAAPGLGLGGGSDARTDAGRMADLDAALRRETIEASADAPGQTVETEARRKTEHGEATVTYARSTTRTFDSGRAVAPPPVPESRRTAVQTYFVRKP